MVPAVVQSERALVHRSATPHRAKTPSTALAEPALVPAHLHVRRRNPRRREADRPDREAIRLGARLPAAAAPVSLLDPLPTGRLGFASAACTERDAGWETPLPVASWMLSPCSSAARAELGPGVPFVEPEVPAQRVARMLVDLLEDPLRCACFDDHVAAALQAWPGDPVDLSVALGIERRRRGLEGSSIAGATSHSRNSVLYESFQRP